MKIKAFTIVELIAALAISAVVSTIGFYAFITVGKTSRIKSEQLDQIERQQELRFLLKFDFMMNHDWELLEGNRLYSQSAELSYVFSENKVVRESFNQVSEFGFQEVRFQGDINGSNLYYLQISEKGKEYDLAITVKNNPEFKNLTVD